LVNLFAFIEHFCKNSADGYRTIKIKKASIIQFSQSSLVDFRILF